jgi:hypothetical protein
MSDKIRCQSKNEKNERQNILPIIRERQTPLYLELDKLPGSPAPTLK